MQKNIFIAGFIKNVNEYIDLEEGEELFDNNKFAIKTKEYVESAKGIQREELN